jgi:hypothetical protein
MPVSPALRKLKQEDHKLKASLRYVERLFKKTKNIQHSPTSPKNAPSSKIISKTVLIYHQTYIIISTEETWNIS